MGIQYSIPTPRSPFVDKSTGLVSREWFLYLNNVFGSVSTFASSGVTASSGPLSTGQLTIADGPTDIASLTGLTVSSVVVASSSGAIGTQPGLGTSTQVLHGNATTFPFYSAVSLTADVSGILPIVNGGTNASTALVNNRLMLSSSGRIVEATSLANGQLFIGSTGSFPVASTLTASTGITITNGAGSIAIAMTSSATSTGVILLSTSSAASTASVDISSGITSSFNDYLVTITDLVTTTDNVRLLLRMSEDGGLTFKAGATDYAFSGVQQTDNNASFSAASTASTGISLGTSLSSTKAYNGEVELFAPSGTVRHKVVSFKAMYEPSGFTISSLYGGGVFKLDTNAINAVRFIPESGFISTGTFSLYAYSK